MKKPTYRLTIFSSFTGIFVQAIICNLVAILFIPLMDLYNLSYVHLGILVGVNFLTQFTVDILFSRVIDKIGYRRFILPTCLVATFGLGLFAATPLLFGSAVLVGFILASVIFSAAGGLLEVALSPLITAIPDTENKSAAMSLLHSFYAWGQVATIVVTTLFLLIFGREHWQWIVLFWMLIPIGNFLCFVRAPFPEVIPETERLSMRQLIFKPFYMMALLAICMGAGAEVVMNQWSSSFMEKGLALPKIWGDLLGMCGFSFFLGFGRVLHGKIADKISILNLLTIGASLAIACYITVALSPIAWICVAACALCGLGTSLLWPGTLVAASEAYPKAGAWMFAILAAFGDLGATIGPAVTGFVIDNTRNLPIVASLARLTGSSIEQGAIRFGILTATVFPICCIGIYCIQKSLLKKTAPGKL